MGMNRREFTQTTTLAILSSLLFACKDNRSYTLKKNMTIACLGDSVTYGGGNGYVEKLQKLANEKRSDLNLTFINWGKSSETITGLTEIGHPGPRPYLFNRLDNLLKTNKVDVLMFCYGINCGIYGKPSIELFKNYQIGILSFLEKAKQKEIDVILVTPPPLVLETVPIDIDTNAAFTWLNPYPKYDQEVLQKFKKIILNTEHKNAVSHIDIHTLLLQNQKHCYADDPIHPNDNGHQLIANTIFNQLVL